MIILEEAPIVPSSLPAKKIPGTPIATETTTPVMIAWKAVSEAFSGFFSPILLDTIDVVAVARPRETA